MTNPTPYNRVRDYADFQAQNPDTPFNGSDLNGDFNGVKAATDSLATCLADIRKDDGTLANHSVGADQLKAEIIGLLHGVNPRGNWATTTAYAVGDLVNQNGGVYIALKAHTSGTFATDLSAGDWMTMSALATAASVAFTPAGGLSSTNVQAALAELGSGKQPLATILTAIAGLTMAADKLIYGTGAGTVALASITAAARSLLAGTDANAMLGVLGALGLAGGTMTGELLLAANPTDPLGATPKQYVDAQIAGVGAVVPSGTVVSFSGFILPAGWLWANGAVYGRSTYPELYAATNKTGTVTMTIASPCVVTWTGHNLRDNWPVKFTVAGGGALPTGITAGTTYYLKSSTSNTFQVSAAPGGSAINTSGSQSGAITAIFSPHGDGDGSTTFKVIDMRGRTAFGLDDMFAGAAGTISSGTPKTIGATLGAETVALVAGNIPSVSTALPTGDLNAGSTPVLALGEQTGTQVVTVGSGSPTAVNKLPPGVHVPWIVKT